MPEVYKFKFVRVNNNINGLNCCEITTIITEKEGSK